jgi:hypothetical protein
VSGIAQDQEKGAKNRPLFSACGADSALCGANVLSAGTLGPFTDIEVHLLTFPEVVPLDTFEAGHVKKHVFAFTGFDKSESAVSKSLDCTFSHCLSRLSSVSSVVSRDGSPARCKENDHDAGAVTHSGSVCPVYVKDCVFKYDAELHVLLQIGRPKTP